MSGLLFPAVRVHFSLDTGAARACRLGGVGGGQPESPALLSCSLSIIQEGVATLSWRKRGARRKNA